MNAQIKAALTNMSLTMANRITNLVDVDSKLTLTAEEVQQRIKASVLSVYEERCANTGKFVASWTFNRDKAAFIMGGSQFKNFDPETRIRSCDRLRLNNETKLHREAKRNSRG